MKKIEDIRILVIGDIMIDKYVVGDANRISAEAPVPIIHVKEEYSTLGGCGNVIRNIREIGSQVSCISRIGDDFAGKEIINKLKELDVDIHFITDEKIPTIQKERIIANEQQVQMLRIDRENVINVKDDQLSESIKDLIYNSKEFDIVIVSDYNKGMITEGLMKLLTNSGSKIIVDPKPANLRCYHNIYMITPNEHEYREIITSSVNNLSTCKYILRTMGKDGMILYDVKSEECSLINSKPVKVYNVSGAGDTVVAIMSICLSSGIDPLISAKIANECAAYVITQPGTSYVPKELFDEITLKILLK